MISLDGSQWKEGGAIQEYFRDNSYQNKLIPFLLFFVVVVVVVLKKEREKYIVKEGRKCVH